MAALGGVTIASALSGCASPTDTASGVEQLDFWHLLSGGDGVTMAGLVEKANAQGKDFDAKQTVLAWGAPYYTKLAMASVGGRGPDTAIMHASRVPGYAPGGLLEPWDLDLLAEYGVQKTDYVDRVWEKGSLNGKQYSIALDAHPFILMYNTDVAEQAGALGADGQLKKITSTDEFVDVARAMQAVTGKHGLSYGYLADGAQMWRLWYTFFKQQDAQFDLSGTSAQVDTDAGVKAFEFMQTLLDGTICTPSGDYGTALSEFLSGDSGMLFTGVWELPTVLASGIAFDAQPIPTLFGTPAAYADSHAFTLPVSDRDEKRTRATYDFVTTLLKGSFGWAQAGHIPAFQPVVNSTEYQELLPQAHYAPAAEILNYDPEAWFTGSGSDFQNFFLETCQGVLLNGSSPQAGLDAFVARIDALMAKPNPV
ncbi:extracellular solute-binding protein [Cellulomonas sp. PhB143]|uniref:extracellular solute-binding protein n=1 Tax=Cellulomonas sp. PhB143 TaxID=2485186 RepID=UPI000F4A66AA|nr:carbohydrate ABC transporter substrate-binding protein (CUT1 family) [Cellulomonas sp. PhB143]